MENYSLQNLVSLCRRRGFVFGGSEIYGGISSIWDYGPLGAMIKKRIKDIWWQKYVQQREDIVGLDSAIIMHQNVFVASGHLEGFADYLIECSHCRRRFRIDKIEKKKSGVYICPGCGKDIEEAKSPPKKFNLMFKTNVSASEDDPQYAYLRPETAQGIFVNFRNVLDSMHKKIPFGIAQIGKAFRNEVTTGSFIFRMKEFEQMEIEYFVHPDQVDEIYRYWVEERYRFYCEDIGIQSNNLRKREHGKDELAHYAKACTDIEYKFPFGWSELEGIACRGDYDLRRHSQVSGKDLTCFDQEKKVKYIPHVIEPSSGVDRTFFAVLADAYREEEVRGKKRVVLSLHPKLAPYQAAVFPLLKNNSDLVVLAKKIFCDIKKRMSAYYDDTAAIGKLYRRQDEIGTPFCITVDVQSLEDKQVTVRDRDTMEQERVFLSRLLDVLNEKIREKSVSFSGNKE